MPPSHEIVFQPDGKRGSFSEKTTVLEAARILGVDINSICGGTGACGKCIVQVMSGELPSSKDAEEKFIGTTGLRDGFRLGCLLRIIDDMVVTVPNESRTGTQRLQTEGLDTSVELPKGKTIAKFEKTDLKKAKEIIGDHACIIGGPPASLFLSGTPAKIDEYVKNLMEQVKEGGGFVLAPGVNIPEEADPVNVKALMDAVEKHGVY